MVNKNISMGCFKSNRKTFCPCFYRKVWEKTKQQFPALSKCASSRDFATYSCLLVAYFTLDKQARGPGIYLLLTTPVTCMMSTATKYFYWAVFILPNVYGCVYSIKTKQQNKQQQNCSEDTCLQLVFPQRFLVLQTYMTCILMFL